jgi:hypothetical protein
VLAGKKLFLAYRQEGVAIVPASTWQEHGRQMKASGRLTWAKADAVNGTAPAQV